MFLSPTSSSCHINRLTNEAIAYFLPTIAAILRFPDDSLLDAQILIRNLAKPLAIPRLIGYSQSRFAFPVTSIRLKNKFVRYPTNLGLRNCLIAGRYLGSNTFGIFYNDIVVKDNKGKQTTWSNLSRF